MDYEPTIRSRNIAEPRTFVTKWEKELNDKASRKKAFSRERDTKRGENFVDTDIYTQEQLSDINECYTENKWPVIHGKTMDSIDPSYENDSDKDAIVEPEPYREGDYFFTAAGNVSCTIM
jgi:hypothetical protein